jgi:hypothetical protein
MAKSLPGRVYGTMWRGPDAETLVAGARFSFDTVSGALEIDPPMDGLPRRDVPLDRDETAFLDAWIRDVAPPGVARIDLGRFTCRQCGDVVPADREHWSCGICLSCSMDNASEMAEREE